MKLNIQTASDHAVLELSFHRHFPRARRLKLRQRLEFSTRFPSHTHNNTHSTHTNANSRILGYRQSLSKIDKPFLTMLDKLCLHFFCSCLQFSVLTRFVCRICLHFDPGFGGFFADKVCLQDLSAFWPSFRRIFCRQSLSAGFVCILARFWRIFCRQSLSAEFVCQDFLCRQSLSAEPLQTNFVCMSTSSSATSTR